MQNLNRKHACASSHCSRMNAHAHTCAINAFAGWPPTLMRPPGGSSVTTMLLLLLLLCTHHSSMHTCTCTTGQAGKPRCLPTGMTPQPGRQAGRQAYAQAQAGAHLHDCQVSWQVQGEPRVLPDLGDGDALQRVHQQHARDEVTSAWEEGGGGGTAGQGIIIKRNFRNLFQN